MTDWYDAKVSASRPAADGLVHVDVDISGTPLVGKHLLPGQYVKLSVEGLGESYFAIASAPDQHGQAFEFLLKRGNPLADAVTAIPRGGSVRISAPAGKGFPLESAQGMDLLLFATGSGISPIRSAIEVIRRHRQSYGQVTLYFGVRTPQSFAYANDFPAWERSGIRVVKTVSRPGASGWDGLTGYVQTHPLPEHALDNAAAFLCGQKPMVQGVTEALVKAGLPKERIFLNF